MKKYEYSENAKYHKIIETDKKAKEFVAKVRAHFFSALQTFISTFIISFGFLMQEADFSEMDEKAFYAFVASSVVSAGRSGMKVVFQTFFPKK